MRFEGNKHLMDEYSGKRGVDRVVGPRRGMTNVYRDTANTRDRNGQICSKLGCSSRANLPKVSQVRTSEKRKSLRPSSQSSSSSKEAIGSSSRMTSNPAQRLIEPRKTLSSQFEKDSSETSIIQDEPETSELIPQPEGECTESSNGILMEVGSSSAVSNTRSQRNLNQRPGLRGQEIKSTGPVRRAVSSRYGLKNLRCNSISDVIPAGCSSSNSNINRRKDTIKNRICEGGNGSTIRRKNITGSLLEGRNSGSRNGISISDSRRSRNIPSQRNTRMAAVRTQRPICGHARGRISSQGNKNPVASSKPPVMVHLSPHSGDLNAPSNSYHTSMETPISDSSCYGRPGNSSEQLCDVMPVSPEEDGITNSLTHQDSFGCIAMVLSAFERIEQDEELTHEQILLLETNLFLNGSNFYDHHRDMRLDIDNMSYEELLALEERMGTVSTALPEEALAECLKRRIYQSAPSDDDESFNEDKEDIKCCICQEEYVVGDEVGGLQCEHTFHVGCIQEWLRLKNWCPICKVSAAQSNSSSPQ